MMAKAINIDFFKNIDTQEKAYWFGFIAADGYINAQENKIVLTSKDLEVIQKFRSSIGSEHKIGVRDIYDKRTGKTYRRHDIQIQSKVFVSGLVAHGLGHLKESFRKLPKIDESLLPSLLAGIFDADGSVMVKGGKMRISFIATKEVLGDVLAYLAKTISIFVSRIFPVALGKNVFKVYLYKDSYRFLHHIYGYGQEREFLTRKYNVYKSFHPIAESTRHKTKGRVLENNRRKYSPELIMEIVASKESNMNLSKRLGISHNHISAIRNGKSWSTITGIKHNQ